MKEKNYIITTKDKLLEINLDEATAQEIHEKYYPNIPEDIFNQIASSDTSGETNLENNKLGKYAKWLLNLYKNNNLRLEDLYKAKEYIPYFKQLSASNKIKDKDINHYKTLPDMYDVIKPYVESGETTSNKELVRKIKSNEAEKVYEDNRYTVIVPKTKEAACYYGKNTQWCTAATSSNNMFDEYNKKGKLYIIIDKQTNKKYQFHYESPQFMDSNNAPIKFKNLDDPLIPILGKIQPGKLISQPIYDKSLGQGEYILIDKNGKIFNNKKYFYIDDIGRKYVFVVDYISENKDYDIFFIDKMSGKIFLDNIYHKYEKPKTINNKIKIVPLYRKDNNHLDIYDNNLKRLLTNFDGTIAEYHQLSDKSKIIILENNTHENRILYNINTKEFSDWYNSVEDYGYLTYSTEDGYFPVIKNGEYSLIVMIPIFKTVIPFGKYSDIIRNESDNIALFKGRRQIGRYRLPYFTDKFHPGREVVKENKIDIKNMVEEYFHEKDYKDIMVKKEVNLFEENARLESWVFQVPDDLFQDLSNRYYKVKNDPSYTLENGYKRLQNIINRNGKLTYEWVKRIKNFWTHYKGDGNDKMAYLNGGYEFRDWINKSLDEAEKSVRSSKEAMKKIGDKNAFIKTHYKDNTGIQTNPDAVSMGGHGTKKTDNLEFTKFESKDNTIKNIVKHYFKEKEKNILEEGVSSNLYHFTNIFALYFILKSKRIAPSESRDEHGRTFVSFSRSKSTTDGYGADLYKNISNTPLVRIEFDGNKLATKYKGQPFDYFTSNEYGGHPDFTKGVRMTGKENSKHLPLHEFEDRIYTGINGIENLKQYIKRIDVYYHKQNIENPKILEITKFLVSESVININLYNKIKDFNYQTNNTVSFSELFGLKENTDTSKNIIEEGFSQRLFHFTLISNLKNILIKNTLFPGEVKRDNKHFVSFSRSKIIDDGFPFHIHKYSEPLVRIEVDGRKLSANYGGKPYDFYYAHGSTKGSRIKFFGDDIKAPTSEFEDRVFTGENGITNFLKYVVRIDVLIHDDDEFYYDYDSFRDIVRSNANRIGLIHYYNNKQDFIKQNDRTITQDYIKDVLKKAWQKF